MRTQTKFNSKALIVISILFAIFAFSSFASAVVVEDVSAQKIFPGETGRVDIDLQNNLQEDVKDVSIVLNLEDTKFTTVGSSEASEEEIRDDDTETFSFVLRAQTDISPGDYNIPFTITYTYLDEKKTKEGSFGVSVGAKTELSYVVETENNVVGEKGKVSLKIVNSGLGDVRFVYVKITGIGFELIGTNQEYIGTVDSDDFETATYDVVFNNENARVTALISYKDLDNKDISQTVDLPVRVYSREKALELGLIKPDNTFIYAILIGSLIVLWLVYRIVKKRRKKKATGK